MKPEMKTIELELTRTIPASPIEVFDGWLDPKCPGTPWSVADKLAWIPTQKKKTNNSPDFLPYFRYNRLFDAGFLVYRYTMFHAVRSLIQLHRSFRFPPFSPRFLLLAISAFTRLPQSDIWGVCLPVKRKN
jgi:hypothetical protein